MKSRSSKLTLAPFDEEENIKFRKFRDEDVILVYNYLCIFAAGETLVLLAFLIFSIGTDFDVESSRVKFAHQLIVSIICGSVWGLGQRFKRHYTLIIGASFVLM